jgi:hypothetical protein
MDCKVLNISTALASSALSKSYIADLLTKPFNIAVVVLASGRGWFLGRMER